MTGRASDTQRVLDAALEEALGRIGDLSRRLWTIRDAHRPDARGRRCRECGRSYPCATVVASGVAEAGALPSLGRSA